MTASLIVSALCLLLVGTFVGVRAVRAARERHWLGGTIRGLVALLLLALAALAATLTVGLHGYRALSFEEVAATVRTEPVAPQRFRATIILPDQRLAMYELAGDAFYMDAHILKWHPWANLLGLHTVYELDRVAGRYNAVGDERTQPHTAYELARSKPVDLYSIARRRLLGPLVDAEYGSATFVAATRPATFEVRVSTTGLLARPAPGRPARPGVRLDRSHAVARHSSAAAAVDRRNAPAMTRCAGPLCGLALLTCAGNPPSIVLPPEGAGSLRLELVQSGFSSPVYLASPPGDTARLFVVEQTGRIQIVQHGQFLPTAFLDIHSRLVSGGEQGLLSVAFHPSYAANGFFYVNYTDLNGDTRVERYTVSVAD